MRIGLEIFGAGFFICLMGLEDVSLSESSSVASECNCKALDLSGVLIDGAVNLNWPGNDDDEDAKGNRAVASKK